MNTRKLLILGFLLIPFMSNAQSISANLKYINAQFAKYNEYETSFRIDEYNKEIICEDKFGILKAKFADIEVKTKNNNFGLFCINSESKCLRNYKKDGTLNETGYSEYTMGLRENGELIPHINTVLAKFSEIKSALVYGQNDFSSTVPTPAVSVGGSVGENLRYINEQFSLYNAYETSFDVDEYNKELICKDKFGTLKAKFEDIEVRAKGKNIGIFCLSSGSECIRTYDELGNLKAAKRKDYTMGLRENDKLIPHINTVLNKFAEIKAAVTGNSISINSNSGFGTNSTIEAEISNVNAIFRRASQYKNVWRFDYAKNAIVGKTKSCETTIPVNPSLGITAYTRTSDYGNGWYFYNIDQSIVEHCTSFKNNTAKTYEYLNSEIDAKSVIASFKKIMNVAKNNRTSSVATVAKPVGRNIAESLNYINQQFKNYNAYNTKFSVDEAKKQLIWTNNFGTTYAYFEDVEVRANYENKWIGIYCLTDDKCIWQISNTSNNRTNYKQYTMSLLENKEMIGHINTVVQEFEQLKRLTLNSGTTATPTKDSDSPD